MSDEHPHRRNGDNSRMAALANSAALTLASRGALIVVMGLVALIAQRSLETLDVMAKDVQALTRNIAVATSQLNDHARRIEKVESKIFK